MKRARHRFSRLRARSDSAILPFAVRRMGRGSLPRTARHRQTNGLHPQIQASWEIWSIFRFGRWLRGAHTRASPLIPETGPTRASQENHRRGFCLARQGFSGPPENKGRRREGDDMANPKQFVAHPKPGNGPKRVDIPAATEGANP